MGVGVVCESERTGKTDAKTRVEWSIVEVLRSPALRRYMNARRWANWSSRA
jgi:hypothetical protein